MNVQEFLRQHGARVTAIVVIVALFGLTRLPTLPDSERAALASQFSFSRFTLPDAPGYATRSVRPVNPSLQAIESWISSVGAAVALNDLDGDGMANDLCYVDTRIDQVIVAPAPKTPARFAPFVLAPAPLPYDAKTMAPMGCLPADLNEDGQMDLLVYYWGRTPVVFLRQAEAAPPTRALAGDSYTPQEVVQPVERWFTNAATTADLDGDGHVDVIIGNYFPDGARILDATATNYEQMQDSMSRAFNGGGKHLLLWAGATAGPAPTVRFTEAQGVLDGELASGWTLALGAADLDQDLLPELYIANDFGPDRLLHNRSEPGKVRFVPLEGSKGLLTAGSKIVGRDSFKGMGVDFADLNGDGQLDMFVSNITAEYALEESNFLFLNTGDLGQMAAGGAPFVDRSEALGLSRSGWGWDARLADFNNDGVLEALQATGFVKGRVNRWPELHELAMGNDWLLHQPSFWLDLHPGDDLAGHQSNPFFVRSASGRYFDLAKDIGLDAPQVSRGIATADVDGDGRLDFAVANQWEPSMFYYNESADPGAFLGLRLLLPVGADATAQFAARPGRPTDMRGRPAIGAAVTVSLPDGSSLVAQVDGGNGHSGKRSPELLLGLGDHPVDRPLQMEVRWRDSSGQTHQQRLELLPGWHTVVLGS